MRKTPWPLVRQLLYNIDHASDKTIHKRYLDTFYNLVKDTDFSNINRKSIPTFLKYYNLNTKETVTSQFKASYNPQSSTANNRKASVLILFLHHQHCIQVLLMKKTQLNEQINKQYKHAGQFAFPGGNCDPNETVRECVLRETHEEVGITKEMINIINETLPETTTSVGLTPIKPFIALPTVSTKELEYVICEKEVDHIYELPLSLLIDGYDPLGPTTMLRSNARYRKEMAIHNKPTSENDEIEEIFEGPVFIIESPIAKVSSLSAREPSCLKAEIWGFSARLLVYIFNGFESKLEQEMQKSKL
jgi:8-oxo-dGTP pyrophosphatase MutT (NUDIX family)